MLTAFYLILPTGLSYRIDSCDLPIGSTTLLATLTFELTDQVALSSSIIIELYV